MTGVQAAHWRWGVVDATSPAPPGVIGLDPTGTVLVVSVLDAEGTDLTDVLAALTLGDVLHVAEAGGGTGGGATDLDDLTDVTIPAGTPAGMVLGTTAPGQWAPVEPFPLDLYHGIQGWQAGLAYQTGAVVRDSTGVYLATEPMPAGTPTTDLRWIPFDAVYTARMAAQKASTLDDLTDVDVHLAATGMLLTKQIDGSWKGANFTRPLNWLTDVAAPADAEGILGTTAPGVWEPLPMDHLQQQIVGPLPAQVAGLDARITALEATPEPTPVDHALTVDNYSGGFTRLINAQVIGTDPVRITVSLATTPGVNGAIFNDLSEISGTANVWADFAGTLGRVEDALTGTPIHGAALKEVIRRGTVIICHRDNTDPSHPTLKVDGTEAAGQPGTSLTLASLADVDNSAATAPAGQVLGTTGTGAWGPVDPPSGGGDPRLTEVVAATYGGATLPPAWVAQAYPAGAIVTHGDAVWVASNYGTNAGDVPGVSLFGWARTDAAHLRDLLEAVIGQPAAVNAWNASDLFTGGAVTFHNGRLWRGAAIVPAGKEPGVAPEWEPFDLAASIDPTGLSVAPPPSGIRPAGTLARPAVESSWGATKHAVWIARHDTTANLPNGLTSNANWRRVTPAENAKAIHEVDVSKWGMWSGSQAAYDALPTKDAATLYVITP